MQVQHSAAQRSSAKQSFLTFLGAQDSCACTDGMLMLVGSMPIQTFPVILRVVELQTFDRPDERIFCGSILY